MEKRFKGVTATLAEWELSNKIVPDEFWAVVRIPSVDGISIGLKIGDGVSHFKSLPWIANPTLDNSFIAKPTTTSPSAIKFLNEKLEFIEVNVNSQMSIDDILTGISNKTLEIPTKTETAYLRNLMYTPPVLTSFTSTSPFIGKVEMGAVVSGSIVFQFS